MANRFNFTVQRQLPKGFVADVTYLFSLTKDLTYSYDVNAADPRLTYQYKDALNVTVTNPFYNYMTPTTFPGVLRTQKTVSVTQFMRPYPQYGGLTVAGTPGGGSKYHSLETKVQKSFSQGYSLMAAYVYRFQRDRIFFNEISTYLQDWTWQDSAQFRHRISLAGVWELPIGKGRTLLGGAPRYLDALVGGWNVSSIVLWRSGNFVRFGPMVVTGNPVISNPTRERYFDTSVFQRLPAYTPRTNPYQYSGLNGPGYFNMDATLAKDFTITEKSRLQLKMNAFNALNGFTPSEPGTNINSSDFGKQLYQMGVGSESAQATYGRRMQFGLQFIF